MASCLQVSIMLDSKIMLTEPLKFPKIQMSESLAEGSLIREGINPGSRADLL